MGNVEPKDNIMRHIAIIPLALLVACGDDGGSEPVDARTIDGRVIDALTIDAPPDGPQLPDAQANVVAVTCPGGNSTPTITVVSSAFSPLSTTISVDDIVKFDMTTAGAAGHNVVPHGTLPTDPGIRVDFNAVTCLRFTVAGTFNFKCNPHGFAGSVVVQ